MGKSEVISNVPASAMIRDLGPDLDQTTDQPFHRPPDLLAVVVDVILHRADDVEAFIHLPERESACVGGCLRTLEIDSAPNG